MELLGEPVASPSSLHTEALQAQLQAFKTKMRSEFDGGHRAPPPVCRLMPAALQARSSPCIGARA